MRFEKFASLLEAGISQSDAIRLSGVEEQSRFELLDFAITSGAPAIETARYLERLEQIDAETQAEILQAEQVPLATKRLVLWLPWLGLVMAELSGLEVVQVLLSATGLALFLAAAALLFLGNWLSKRMIANSRKVLDPDFAAVKLWIMLSTGIGFRAALEKSSFDPADPLIDFAKASGVSLAQLLDIRARESLLACRTQRLSAAKSLSVKLMIPLGMTTLPAFLLLTVVPILLGTIR